MQTHEARAYQPNHIAQTIGAICLGPTDNDFGSHYFLSLHTDLKTAQNTKFSQYILHLFTTWIPTLVQNKITD